MNSARKNEINKLFYHRNKERILAELREKYKNNKEGYTDTLKQRNKDYRENNKDNVKKSKQAEKLKNNIRYSLYYRWKNMMKRCNDVSVRIIKTMVREEYLLSTHLIYLMSIKTIYSH